MSREKDLIKLMMRVKYKGFTESLRIHNVLLDGNFYTLSFIHKNNCRKAIFTQTFTEDGIHYKAKIFHEINFSSKEGNQFYKDLMKHEKISKRGKNIMKLNNKKFEIKKEYIDNENKSVIIKGRCGNCVNINGQWLPVEIDNEGNEVVYTWVQVPYIKAEDRL